MDISTKVILAVGVVAAGVTAAGIYEHVTATPVPTPTVPPAPGGSGPPKNVPTVGQVPITVIGGTPPITQPAPPAVAAKNAVTLYLGPGVQFAPSVGAAGSTLTLMVPATGGTITAPSTVDGFSSSLRGGVLDPAGQSDVVVTGRSSGTITVEWNDASGQHQQSLINYGTPPKTSVPQTLELRTTSSTSELKGAGVPGSLIVLAPPALAGYELATPYTIDGAQVDFQEGPGASVSVLTTNWSGLITIQARNPTPDAKGDYAPNITYTILYGP